MRHNARKDSTHDEIRDALKADGWNVTETHKCGGGLPDMFATRFPIVIAVEAKSEDGEMTPAEIEWRKGWDGPYIMPRSGAEAVAMAAAYRLSKSAMKLFSALIAVNQHD